jgi:MinD-like ATPase involved in chromosome partitioning or flagellar assembly
MDVPNNDLPKSIAIVSGKGGSGKTMIAATLAKILDDEGKKVLLVDADFATGGLTYYMGLKTVRNISTGLTNFIKHEKELDKEFISGKTQKMFDFHSSHFVGVGDHRRLYKYIDHQNLQQTIAQFLKLSSDICDVVLIDCRGGIDEESISVCSQVEKVLIVAETDTTSFQATQHLVDVLYDNDLSEKLSGFIINKVFDDPSAMARSGTAAFKTQYLASIPFDLDATRSFLIGEIPKLNTLFAKQVRFALSKAYPELIPFSEQRTLEHTDFRGLSVRDNDSLLGGMLLSFTSLAIGTPLIYTYILGAQLRPEVLYIGIASLLLISTISGIEHGRRAVGRIFSLYSRMIKRIFGIK